MSIIKKFHWYWAWQDEQEEDWLRQQSLVGLHFQSVSFPGKYTFKKGGPIDYVYRLDYFYDKKEMPEYLQLFEDSGWNHLGEMNGWQYFRIKNVAGDLPEIYSDNASKAKKYERIILFLVIFLPIYLNFFNISGRSESEYMQVFSVVMSGFMLLYVYAMVRLVSRYFSLKKKV